MHVNTDVVVVNEIENLKKKKKEKKMEKKTFQNLSHRLRIRHRNLFD